jgi:hypothetical protein
MTSECSDTMRCGTRVIWGLVLTFTDHRGRFDVTTGRTSRARAGGHGTLVSGPARHGFGCIPFTTLHNPSQPFTTLHNPSQPFTPPATLVNTSSQSRHPADTCLPDSADMIPPSSSPPTIPPVLAIC